MRAKKREAVMSPCMNPQSILFPAAPGEAPLEMHRAYQHAHTPQRTVLPDASGKEAVRARFLNGQLTFEKAVERLRRTFNMTWTDAGLYLEHGI